MVFKEGLDNYKKILRLVENEFYQIKGRITPYFDSDTTSLFRSDRVDKSGRTEVSGTLDDMTFYYTGNRLTSVTNSTEAVAFEGMTGLGKLF